MNNSRSERNDFSQQKIYFKYILTLIVLVLIIATIQHVFVYGEIKFKYYFAPIVIGTFIGILLARASILKKQLIQKKEQFRAIADFALEFTYYRTIDGQYEYVSPSCQDITGFSQEEFYQQPNLMDSLIHPDDINKWKNHVHNINDARKSEIMDIRLISKDKKTIWISHLCSPVFDDNNKQIGVRSTNLDITERHQLEEKHKQMALNDSLTGLPNRYALINEIERYMSGDYKGNVFTLFFLDLSRFKNINEHFGHSFGDRLLIEISNRLKNINQELFVSRFGGDEFILLAPEIIDNEEARKIADKVISTIKEPIYIEDLELFMNGTIGVAFFSGDSKEPEKLISSAEVAKRKAQGKYDELGIDVSGLSDHIKHFIFTEHSIHKALKNNEFEVYYQPKINSSTEKIIGLEALIRWNHPDKGMIMPGDFIQITEETGQVIDIGNYIVEKCLSDMERWKSDNINIPVAINISARQFSNQSHCEECLTKIMHSKIDNNLIELEVTEQVFLSESERCIHRLNMFREAGISIALDDFGTGYSSLYYLKMLPIDTLKLDMSFIKELSENNKSYSIVKAILQMSKELKLKTVAEGVETEKQKILLNELNCEIIQGYLYYKPMPVRDIEVLLKNTCC